MFRLWFSFKNNKHTIVILFGIFENALKKVINRQKRHFGHFWKLITFFSCILKNTDLNNILDWPKFWIWTSKIMPDLWLVDLFCPIKKNFHTPPYCAVKNDYAQSLWWGSQNSVGWSRPPQCCWKIQAGHWWPVRLA